MPRPLRIGYPDAIDPVNNPHNPVRSDSFAYDALGNRKGWNYVANKGWMSFLRRDNGLNQYTSWENNDPNPPGHWGTAMYYDDNSPWAPHTAPPGNGVMMAEGNLVASYDALNQPVAMIPTGSPNIYWFGYDPLGRCVKRVVGPSMESGTATYFYYDGWNLIQEGPSATASDRIYMLGNGEGEKGSELSFDTAGGRWPGNRRRAKRSFGDTCVSKQSLGTREGVGEAADWTPRHSAARVNWTGRRPVATEEAGNNILPGDGKFSLLKRAGAPIVRVRTFIRRK